MVKSCMPNPVPSLDPSRLMPAPLSRRPQRPEPLQRPPSPFPLPGRAWEAAPRRQDWAPPAPQSFQASLSTGRGLTGGGGVSTGSLSGGGAASEEEEHQFSMLQQLVRAQAQVAGTPQGMGADWGLGASLGVQRTPLLPSFTPC